MLRGRISLSVSPTFAPFLRLSGLNRLNKVSDVVPGVTQLHFCQKWLLAPLQILSSCLLFVETLYLTIPKSLRIFILCLTQ